MKIWWACRAAPANRYRRLAEFAAQHRLKREADFWTNSRRVIEEMRPD